MLSDEKLMDMLDDALSTFDYDTYKLLFDPVCSEYPREARDLRADVLKIVKRHLQE